MINDRRWKIFHVIRLWEGISFFFLLCVGRSIESVSLDIDEYRSMEWNDRSGAFHMEIGVFLEF